MTKELEGGGADGLCPVLLEVDEGIQLWDLAGCKRYFNPATIRQFGAVAEVPGIGFDTLAVACLDEAGQPLPIGTFPVARVMADGQHCDDVLVQVTGAHLPGRWLRINAHALPDGMGIVSSTVDVTQLVEREHRLQHQAHYDALTGLPNRVLLADRMKLSLAHARRTGDMLAVCLMDLDGFKPVNDSLGHKAGDYLLQEMARRLEEVIRADDTAARLGGDEFALLLGNLKSAQQAEHALQRVLDAVATPCMIEGKPVRVTASIGVTLFPGDAGEADQLLRHADQAMYKAKEAGKGRFHMFNPAVESRLRANQGLLKRIEEALDKGQFALYYQPKVDCRNGSVVGMEALIRWQHPVLGLRAPGEFLPLIEHDDIIVRLGEWVIAESLRQMAVWRESGIHVGVSVNVSARQFLRGGFGDRLADMLAHHLPGLERKLELELVETAALEDVNAVRKVMEHYQKLGMSFALDDFGTGYSSLVHLKRLAVDVLKIDQTFVRDMLDDPGDLAIVQGVIGLASAFGQKVVAEGVESIEQILLLLELGCDVMQGYGIARPMAAERVPGWLAAFQADPRWQLARTSYPMRGDFELLLMEVSHRHWLERTRVALQHGSALPAADYGSCRFTQWYAGAGIRRYGGLPEFREIDMTHRKVHKQAEALAACVHAADGAGAEALRLALEAANETLLQQLHSFRIGLAGAPAKD
jgi:diguanylate cyclase (GGDEF)-like protein